MPEDQTTEIPVQPQVPIQQPETAPVLLKKKFDLRVIVILLIAILLIGTGLIYAGMQIEKKQVEGGLVNKITPTPIPQPTRIVTQLTEIPTIAPTSDETANWKTYTNSKYHFTFKYPFELQIKSQNKAGESVVSDENIDFLEISRPHLSSPISVIVEKKAYSDMLVESDKEFGVNLGNLVDKTEVMVGGVKGTKIKGTDVSSGGGKEAVYLPRNGYVVVIKVVQDSRDQNLINIFDQILSTFRFIE